MDMSENAIGMEEREIITFWKQSNKSEKSTVKGIYCAVDVMRRIDYLMKYVLG